MNKIDFDYVALTQALVKCPSVTPYDEGALQVVEDHLKDLGFECTRLPFSEDGFNDIDNLFAIIGETGKHLAFAGHTDVVPPGNERSWKYPPFSGKIADEKIYGRGTEDMKGNIACFMSATNSFISKYGKDFGGKLSFIITGDEEKDAINGTVKMMEWTKEKNIKFDHCIVGEPTSMEVVIGHKGKCARRVQVRGHACHSGQSPFGVNAIDYASELIVYIRQLAREKEKNGPFDKDYEVPYTTLHTGVIQGGTALNIVPNFCQFDFEIRHLYEEDPQHLLDKIEAYTRDHLETEMRSIAADTGFDFETLATYPGLLTDPGIEFVSYVKQLLDNDAHSKVTFGTEGGLFQKRLGIPTLVCGPGNIDQAHKANEFISLEQLQIGGKFLDCLIQSLN